MKCYLLYQLEPNYAFPNYHINCSICFIVKVSYIYIKKVIWRMSVTRKLDGLMGKIIF